MKDIHNNPLFSDITAEEEVSVQGGAVPAILVAAIKSGIPLAIGGAIAATAGWLFQNGNGVIVGDRKGSSSDRFRAGKGIYNDRDLPNGWNWGIKDGGQWVMGGYNGPKP